MRIIVVAALLALVAGSARAAEVALVEHPGLAAEIARGALPPIAERVPQEPMMVEVPEPGREGGELRILMSGAKDTRLMTVYGYARLVRYTPELELVPDDPGSSGL